MGYADLIKIKNKELSDQEKIQETTLINSEVELANRVKLAVQAATIHIDGLLGTKSFKTQSQTSVRESLKRARSGAIESAVVKVFDIPPTIKSEELKQLFYNYVKPESMEIEKETEKHNILIKFSSVNEAKKSIELSGKFLGEFKLKVEYWIDFSLKKKINMLILPHLILSTRLN